MNPSNIQDTPKARLNKSDRCGCVCHDHKAKWESCDDCLLFHDAPSSQETLSRQAALAKEILALPVRKESSAYQAMDAWAIAEFMDARLALVQQEADTAARIDEIEYALRIYRRTKPLSSGAIVRDLERRLSELNTKPESEES